MDFKTGCNPRSEGVVGPIAFKSFLSAQDLPPAPEKVYREYKIAESDWQMFGNDTIGDCTCAAIAHMIMMFTAHTGKMVTPDPADVIDFYSAITGYDPKTGANDDGANLPDVLNRWRDVGLCGHKILQWGDVPVTDQEAQKHAIHIFGGVDDAILMPPSAMVEFSVGNPWDDTSSKGTDGHSVPGFGYGSDGTTCITWAKIQHMSWAWRALNLFECCAVITQDWLDQADGLTPSGFPLDRLVAYLKEL